MTFTRSIHQAATRASVFSFALSSLLGLAALSSSAAHAQLTSVGGPGVDYLPGPAHDYMACVTNTPTNAETALNGTLRSNCPDTRVTTDLLDKRVRDIFVHSVALNDNVWMRVILPASWTPTTTTQYPVLMLLTGHGAGFQSFTCNTFIQNYVSQSEVIVVMPDAHRKYDRCARAEAISNSALPGWYSDWQTPTTDGSPEKWETFHTSELPAFMHTYYHASATQYVVGGLSMGGYGAVKYLMNHPTLFKAGAAYSGLLNTVTPEGDSAISATIAAASQDTNDLWGYYPNTPGDNATGHVNVWNINNPAYAPNAAKFLNLKLFVSAGSGAQGSLASSYDVTLSSLEAAAHASVVNFVDAVRTANGGVNLPAGLHTEITYAGMHMWRYWDAELCRSLPGLMSAVGVAYSNPLTCNTP